MRLTGVRGEGAPETLKVAAFDEAIQTLMSIQGRFTRRAEHVDLKLHGVNLLDQYHERAGNATLTGVPPGSAIIGIPDAVRGHVDPSAIVYSIDDAMPLRAMTQPSCRFRA